MFSFRINWICPVNLTYYNVRLPIVNVCVELHLLIELIIQFFYVLFVCARGNGWGFVWTNLLKNFVPFLFQYFLSCTRTFIPFLSPDLPLSDCYLSSMIFFCFFNNGIFYCTILILVGFVWRGQRGKKKKRRAISICWLCLK